MEIKNKADILEIIQKLQQDFAVRWKKRGIDGLISQMGQSKEEMERPDFWENPQHARQISQQRASQEKLLSPWREIEAELADFPDLIEITCAEYDERNALKSLEKELSQLQEHYENLLTSEALIGEDDRRNAIVNITPGAGGTESQDWAEMLLRMYLKWCDRRGFAKTTLDLQSGEEAGIKNATLIITGAYAYGLLKSENGIHRLVRISPFDSNKRRHTSFAAVHIIPEIDESIEVEIDEKDLRIDTYRASGAGGQHVNKTDSAIRITHIPTNIIVQCQNERSQHKNRASAMKMLRARLYELQKEKMHSDLESRAGEKKEVTWGNQIRSYVLHPYKMVKDLRSGYETGNVEAVLNGELNPFIDAYLKTPT